MTVARKLFGDLDVIEPMRDLGDGKTVIDVAGTPSMRALADGVACFGSWVLLRDGGTTGMGSLEATVFMWRYFPGLARGIMIPVQSEMDALGPGKSGGLWQSVSEIAHASEAHVTVVLAETWRTKGVPRAMLPASLGDHDLSTEHLLVSGETRDEIYSRTWPIRRERGRVVGLGEPEAHDFQGGPCGLLYRPRGLGN